MHSQNKFITRLLLTGAGGILGRRLVAAVSDDYKSCRHYHHLPADGESPDVFAGDIGDRDHVKNLAERLDPDIIVNSAAFANVDRCETEPDMSKRVNVDAVNNLIHFFPQSKLVQISTDYVFGDSDHRGSSPPAPDDSTHPMNIYGRHKLEAERAVRMASNENLVIRVNTLFDHTVERNFFRFVYDSLRQKKEIFCLTDQISNPISAFDCAELIVQLIDRGASGVSHLGGAEFISRYDFAVRIADWFELDASLIRPATSEENPRPARRPSYAGLDCRLTEKYLGWPMPSTGDGFSRIEQEM